MSITGIILSIFGILVFLAFVEAIIKSGKHHPLSQMRPTLGDTLDDLPDELGNEGIDKEKFNSIIARNRALSGSLFSMRRSRLTQSIQRQNGPVQTDKKQNYNRTET